MSSPSVVGIAFGVILLLIWLNATLYARRRLPPLGLERDYAYRGRHGGTVVVRRQSPLPPIELVEPDERVQRRLD
ncbi:hypothetical protein [Synechococcus sp. RS9916]|uniref:hypothetical protein n=1 Tax=Synechococcus sp. RS9916 TaxID=221359 RepID=UPI00056F3BDF|nr:hypothetical protein [Synechococcus sp. RS9916]